MKKLNISQLAVNTRKAEFPFMESMPGFKVTLQYLSRAEINKIRTESMVHKEDPQTGVTYEELDTNAFTAAYSKRAVSGWVGFKVEYLAKLLLIDEQDLDSEDLVEYSEEDVVYLMANASVFDTWVSQKLKNLDNFRN